jgi:DNA-binding NarL/FixJ family response regulator
VILVDDSVLFREGLARVLAESGHEVVAQRGDTQSLGAVVAELDPDIVVLDIKMPPTHTTEGLVAAEEIRQGHPELGVLVLSQYVETHHAMKLLADQPERIGYLLKDRVTDPSQLTDAIEQICAGRAVIDPEVVSNLLRKKRTSDPLDRLTERERDVLGLMAEGRSNAAIASQLFLGTKTVETHVRNIFTKLDLPEAADDHRRVLAVLAYLRGTAV